MTYTKMIMRGDSLGYKMMTRSIYVKTNSKDTMGLGTDSLLGCSLMLKTFYCFLFEIFGLLLVIFIFYGCEDFVKMT